MSIDTRSSDGKHVFSAHSGSDPTWRPKASCIAAGKQCRIDEVCGNLEWQVFRHPLCVLGGPFVTSGPLGTPTRMLPSMFFVDANPVRTNKRHQARRSTSPSVPDLRTAGRGRRIVSRSLGRWRARLPARSGCSSATAGHPLRGQSSTPIHARRRSSTIRCEATKQRSWQPKWLPHRRLPRATIPRAA